MSVRIYRSSDAAALAQIFVRSVRGIASRVYTDAQVHAWASEAADAAETAARCADGRLVLVATNGADEAVAFIDLEMNGHIDMLYCLPEHAGRGLASQLYDQLEQATRARGISRLFVEASEAAKPFFQRKGFTVAARRDFAIGSVPIHNYAMEKILDT